MVTCKEGMSKQSLPSEAMTPRHMRRAFLHRKLRRGEFQMGVSLPTSGLCFQLVEGIG